MEETYVSKRDLWLMLLVFASAAATAFSGVSIWFEPATELTRLAISATCAVLSIFIVDLAIRTDYTLDRDELLVRCGCLRWHVPYHAIESARRSRTLISGPALSLDRVVITRGDSRFPLIISPVDRQRFLEDLAGRDEALHIVEGDIVRRELS